MRIIMRMIMRDDKVQRIVTTRKMKINANNDDEDENDNEIDDDVEIRSTLQEEMTIKRRKLWMTSYSEECDKRKRTRGIVRRKALKW